MIHVGMPDDIAPDGYGSSMAPESDELVVTPQEGMSTRRLESFLDEISRQPPWRRVADRECEYYDGNQLTAEEIDELEDRGFKATIINMIQPTINVVLGMEVKTRSDWLVRSEDGEISEDMAEALSRELHKAEVATRADRAFSDAYADAIKIGLGWLEISRCSDPWQGPYRAKRVHRREIFWDWRSQEPDLSDCRYLVRKRWLDQDTAAAAFPEHKDLIANTINGWANWDKIAVMNNAFTLELNRALEVQRGFSIEQYEWLNSVRKRIACYEVWYRVVTRGYILQLPNGRKVEFDEKNDEHVGAVLSGAIVPKPAVFNKVRVSWWLGPHRVSDEPSPYKHNHFPYVPLWGFREDRTGTPYGMIRAMLSPQDEINARRSKMLWLLNSRRVITDSDSVLDHNQAAEEVGRPDAYIVLNATRKQTSQFQVEDGAQLAPQQFQVLETAKAEIAQTSGVYQSMMGQSTGTTANSAINTLVEQGSTVLAEINDNARFARRLAGEMLLELVREDLAEKMEHVVLVGDEGEEQRAAVLNQPAGVDELGNQILANDVTRCNVAVVLDDVAQSPTFKQQQMTMLAELVKSAPPNMQNVLYELVVEAMDLPKKKKVLERVRKAAGLGPNGEMQDPQVLALQQQIEQLNAALQQTTQTAGQHVQELEQQLAEAQLALKDKSEQNALKAREVAMKEADVALKAGNAQVDQAFRAEEAQAARDIQSASLAQKHEARQAKAAGGIDPNQLAQLVAQVVQQAVAPIAQRVDQLLQLEAQERGGEMGEGLTHEAATGDAAEDAMEGEVQS